MSGVGPPSGTPVAVATQGIFRFALPGILRPPPPSLPPQPSVDASTLAVDPLPVPKLEYSTALAR